MADKKIKVDIVADYDDRGADEAMADARKLDGTKAEIEITADTSKLGDQLDELGGKLGGQVGGTLTALSSPGGAIAALGAGLLYAADRATDLAIQADNLARLTGDSVEEASQLAGVWQSTGAEVTDLQDVLLQMQSTLADNADITNRLGINLADGASGGERFQQVVDALELIPNATERAMVASKLFGEEGVRQVNALTGQYEDLGAAMDDIKPMSAEDAAQARKTKAEIAELTREFQNMVAVLGTAAIPVLGVVFGAITGFEDLGRGVRDFVDAGARANHEITDAFNASEDAAANFDTELLKGLTSFDQVLAKVLELTDSEHAANVVALEWLGTHEALARVILDLPGNDPRTAAQGLGQTLAGGAQNILNGRAAPAAMVVNNYLPPGGPTVTAEDLGTYRTRNSSRTNG